jgi:alkanesulfonate monooxygenase SsuD/methylene tetrahydromethanopterin reductase-like flavin-dependent oxidoreductase (luciferase family)
MARRAEELGYSSLLMPDGMQLLSPLLALALAEGATTSLHVGTFVLASPLLAGR